MKTNTDSRRELASLSIFANRLAARAVTIGDEETALLARVINARIVALCQDEEAANGPLPPISAQAAGLHVPLELLDTPANRRLLRALEEAHDAARAVDHERGYGEDGPAQDLEDWVCKTREEVYGPAGARE